MQNSQAPIQNPQIRENECASSSWGCSTATEQVFLLSRYIPADPQEQTALTLFGLRFIWTVGLKHLSTKINDSVKMTHISKKKEKNWKLLHLCLKNPSRKNFLCTEDLALMQKKRNFCSKTSISVKSGPQ